MGGYEPDAPSTGPDVVAAGADDGSFASRTDPSAARIA